MPRSNRDDNRLPIRCFGDSSSGLISVPFPTRAPPSFDPLLTPTGQRATRSLDRSRGKGRSTCRPPPASSLGSAKHQPTTMPMRPRTKPTCQKSASPFAMTFIPSIPEIAETGSRTAAMSREPLHREIHLCHRSRLVELEDLVQERALRVAEAPQSFVLIHEVFDERQSLRRHRGASHRGPAGAHLAREARHATVDPPSSAPGTAKEDRARGVKPRLSRRRVRPLRAARPASSSRARTCARTSGASEAHCGARRGTPGRAPGGRRAACTAPRQVARACGSRAA